ncbi:MAG: hypothetical protein WBH03_01820 [Cyclobacteriaceae bacterium]
MGRKHAALPEVEWNRRRYGLRKEDLAKLAIVGNMLDFRKEARLPEAGIDTMDELNYSGLYRYLDRMDSPLKPIEPAMPELYKAFSESNLPLSDTLHTRLSDRIALLKVLQSENKVILGTIRFVGPDCMIFTPPFRVGVDSAQLQAGKKVTFVIYPIADIYPEMSYDFDDLAVARSDKVYACEWEPIGVAMKGVFTPDSAGAYSITGNYHHRVKRTRNTFISDINFRLNIKE